MKYRRRSTRKLEDIPSLFGEEEIYGHQTASPSTVVVEPPGDEKEGELVLDDQFRRAPHRLRFMSLGSGSSGNCAYVGTPQCGLIIDAGVDNKFVMSELARNGIDPDTIRGVLLTHDHGDHVRYVYALVRHQRDWKIYATPRTIEGIFRRHNISRRIRDYHSPIYKEHEYLFDDIKVVPFATSHDGADNMGYFISMGDTRLSVCTDTGVITERADFYLQQSTAIMIESNYDEHMLTYGPYREYLKARIRSEIGHLDNMDAARYIASIYKPTLTHVLLCHLSEENNTPEIALAAMTDSLKGEGIDIALSSGDIRKGSVYLSALPRYRSSELYVL